MIQTSSQMSTEPTFLEVVTGQQTFRFYTDTAPLRVWTTIEAPSSQGCGNLNDGDYVQVVLRDDGFDLMITVVSDSAQIGWIVETSQDTQEG